MSLQGCKGLTVYSIICNNKTACCSICANISSCIFQRVIQVSVWENHLQI